MRPYLKEFLQLPFQTEASASSLKQALVAASVYFRDRMLPLQTPTSFCHRPSASNCSMPAAPSFRKCGNSDWRWRCAMPCAGGCCICREAATTSLFGRWCTATSNGNRRRADYGPRSAKADCDVFLARMQRELDEQAEQTAAGLADNAYASITEDRLKLSRDPADP